MIEQANEFNNDVPVYVLPSFDSQTNFGYVQTEVHFNTAKSIDAPPAPNLNISNHSIDSYMRDIGDSYFLSLINPSLPFDQPCCSYDLIPEPSIPSIFDIPPTYPRHTPFNYQYPPISHASSPISSESSSPPFDSGIFSNSNTCRL